MAKIDEQIGGIFSRLGELKVDIAEIKVEMMRRSDVEGIVDKQCELCNYKFKTKKTPVSIIPDPNQKQGGIKLTRFHERLITLILIVVLGLLGFGPEILAKI